MVQGETLLVEALGAGWSPQVLLAREDFVPGAELGPLLERGPGGRAHPVSRVEGPAFDALNDTSTPQGVLGVFGIPADVSPRCAVTDWYIVADRIADPGNLGTIVRSAEAAGASGVVVTRGTADPFSPKAVRASAGALFHVPIHFVEDLMDDSLGPVRLVGTTSHSGTGTTPLWDADLTGCVGFVFGNEPRGLGSEPSLRSWISIPHVGRSESLNVAMAAAVVAMYTAHRRGSTGGTEGVIQHRSAGPSD